MALRDKIVSFDQAAVIIRLGMTMANSGFTSAGCPKVVQLALAARINVDTVGRNRQKQSKA